MNFTVEFVGLGSVCMDGINSGFCSLPNVVVAESNGQSFLAITRGMLLIETLVIHFAVFEGTNMQEADAEVAEERLMQCAVSVVIPGTILGLCSMLNVVVADGNGQTCLTIAGGMLFVEALPVHFAVFEGKKVPEAVEGVMNLAVHFVGPTG